MKKLLLSFSLAAISPMVAGASELVPVFQENFSRCTSDVIQGGYFSENSYFTSADHGDHDGWYTKNAYESERAIKFNAKTKPSGYALSPAINFSTTTAHTVVVRFRAQKWAHNDDKVNVFVAVEGNTASAQKVDPDGSTNISDRSEAPFELTFTDVPDGSQFRFYAEKKDGAVTDRWFLSDIVVLEERDDAGAPAIAASAGYQRFNDIMIGNDSEVRTLQVSATGLAADLEIEQSASSDFAVEKGSDWNARRGGTLHLRFDPQLAGDNTEDIILRSGTAEKKITLRGHSKVYAPVADGATDVSADAFTACWHRVAGLDRIELSVYTKEEGTLVAPDLMFSKYIEGSSNNRAVEIFNGTGHDVALDGYRMLMESNGAGGLTFGEYAFKADAVIPAGGTYTVCNAQFGAVRDIADATIGYSDGGYANIMTFTGDDAIGLFGPDGTLIDLLGYESTDTNDEVSKDWGMDVTLYRKSTSYMPSDKFDINEWDRYPKDYCEGFGTHTMDATGLVKREIRHLSLERGTTSARIEGVADAKACFYTVQGHSGALKTPASAEIAVSGQSGITDIAADTADSTIAFSLTGNVLHTAAGATVCDSLGRSIPVAADGTAILPARGIYIISLGGRAAKVAY